MKLYSNKINQVHKKYPLQGDEECQMDIYGYIRVG
jgi:hypothetical protein